MSWVGHANYFNILFFINRKTSGDEGPEGVILIFYFFIKKIIKSLDIDLPITKHAYAQKDVYIYLIFLHPKLVKLIF